MTVIEYAISSCLALIPGAVATIAEAPHMLVPTAIKTPNLLGNESNLVKI